MYKCLKFCNFSFENKLCQLSTKIDVFIKGVADDLAFLISLFHYLLEHLNFVRFPDNIVKNTLPPVMPPTNSDY